VKCAFGYLTSIPSVKETRKGREKIYLTARWQYVLAHVSSNGIEGRLNKLSLKKHKTISENRLF